MRLAGDIAIGRYRFATPTVTVRALPPGFPTEAIVGARVLSQFTVTLDQLNARLRLARDGPDAVVLEEPTPRPAGRQSDVVGKYGVREIRLEADGRLILQREGGPPLEMMPAGVDAFMLKDLPQAQIQVVRDATRRDRPESSEPRWPMGDGCAGSAVTGPRSVVHVATPRQQSDEEGGNDERQQVGLCGW